MLLISRQPGQRVRLKSPSTEIWITVERGGRNDGSIRLAIEAPLYVEIEREEIIGKPARKRERRWNQR